MATTLEFAEFTSEVRYENLSPDVREALKRRLLDSVGVGIAAADVGSPTVVDRTIADLEADGPCTLWGRDRGASPVQAAMHNTALVAASGCADSYLAPKETSHPSDTAGALVAAGEYAGATGEELLAALAVAYEIQGELAWNAPVRDRGFDHVTHAVVSAAAGASTLFDLDLEETRDAIAVAATGHNALGVTRTGRITDWSGVASASAARNAVYAAMLAERGMAGPRGTVDGRRGWEAVVSGPFEFDPTPGERVRDVTTRRYVAETYAQSAAEGIVELAEGRNLNPGDVAGIKLETFAEAKRLLGGGEGNRYEVADRAQATHSLPYVLATALLDRDLSLAQYEPDRIGADDVQDLLRIVDVTADPDLTERFQNGELPAVVDVTMDDGTTYRIEKDAFRGHSTAPMGWDEVETKFDSVTEGQLENGRRERIVETVRSLEDRDVADLTALLARG
ncbi:MmgE/PrpD family protein [Natronococcus sp. A-GB7]|uniref:MmgE/PrpD family protein n=1 Tax=Natronococcus sp. A-GB7 TaxID=3037649 RepID=UPI00241F0D0F|nr:MmgE/PrpD family protein [Natronococcus sp. A-GB7]MDG5819610.1 MmgE/PrpD family protein [Natronococcus sp. A-GB7]